MAIFVMAPGPNENTATITSPNLPIVFQALLVSIPSGESADQAPDKCSDNPMSLDRRLLVK